MSTQQTLDPLYSVMPLADLLAFRRAQVGACYAGIGSRETPLDVLALMTRIARKLDADGWTLRSGGADGADTAFEQGASLSGKEVFTPWAGFNACTYAKLSNPSPMAFEIAAQHHPNWYRLQEMVKRLHARNVHQVLGADCASSSAFVLCWTPDGATDKTTSRTGGTGQAIRIANAYGVPVFNLQREDHRAQWQLFAS